MGEPRKVVVSLGERRKRLRFVPGVVERVGRIWRVDWRVSKRDGVVVYWLKRYTLVEVFHEV